VAEQSAEWNSARCKRDVGNSRRDTELAAAQTNLLQLQAKVDALSQERENAAQHVLALETKVDELTQRVRDREQAIDQHQGRSQNGDTVHLDVEAAVPRRNVDKDSSRRILWEVTPIDLVNGKKQIY
jgi:hypothetical protein